MDNPVKKVAILGSTGSIGRQTLEIIRAFPDKFKVIALAAGKNIDLLVAQIREFKPELIYASTKLPPLENGKFLTMEEIAKYPEVDIVVVATSGKVGLLPTLAALKAGKRVALANKEVLVMAGEIVIKAKQYKNQILPIDSEHSAIWQCLQGEENKINRLFLTASGGPFYKYPLSRLYKVTVAEALHHPTWKMGKKVTIDSATLMNKGLEIIEAHWLFNVPFNKIEVIIHPQSIVHSIVEFSDKSLKAQLSFPDMRLPIQYALSYPERLPNLALPHLDLCQVSPLNFEPVDYNRFPCLRLAREAGEKGGTYPAVLCAADEVAVELFLNNQISFMTIPKIIDKTLALHQGINQPSLDEIFSADIWARETALNIAQGG